MPRYWTLVSHTHLMLLQSLNANGNAATGSNTNLISYGGRPGFGPYGRPGFGPYSRLAYNLYGGFNRFGPYGSSYAPYGGAGYGYYGQSGILGSLARGLTRGVQAFLGELGRWVWNCCIWYCIFSVPFFVVWCVNFFISLNSSGWVHTACGTYSTGLLNRRSYVNYSCFS